MAFVNGSVLCLKLFFFLYSLVAIMFSYYFLSSGFVISPSLYALASSASDLYCAMFANGFGGGPVAV